MKQPVRSLSFASLLTRRAAITLNAALLACLSACTTDPTKGYSFNSTYDESIRTVAVSLPPRPSRTVSSAV